MIFTSEFRPVTEIDPIGFSVTENPCVFLGVHEVNNAYISHADFSVKMPANPLFAQKKDEGG